MPGYTHETLTNALEAKPVKFSFMTGNVRYEAVLHKDRQSYERTKGQSGASTPTSTSSTSSESGSSSKASN